MSFCVQTAFLSDDEAGRLYRRRPELARSPEVFCPTCDKRGTYRWRGLDHLCNCAEQLQLAKLYSAAGIGDAYQRMDFHDLGVDAHLVEQVVSFLENHRRYVARGMGLMLSGSVGTGKTLLATLVLKELIKLGYSGFATTFANTVEMFTAGWRSAEDKQYFQTKFMHTQILLLDDLGRELRTGHNLPASTFDMILRSRVQDARPTLLTTNATLAELETGYGAAVLSLLKEVSLSWEFSGEDFRTKANRRTLNELADGETRPIC